MHRIVTVGAAAAVAMALLMPGAGAQTSPAAKPVTDPAVAATEAVAAKARAVLDAHCATCHQAGRLAGLTPGRAIGNILALDDLARNPSLVQPGNPDASPLYLSMLTRRMPPEPTERATRKEVPSSADLDAVRDWIERLPRDLGCSARKPIEAGDQKALIQRAVEQRPASRRGQLRFISLVHLYNACASEREIKGYGQAIARLLNGVSWAPLPTRLEPADETGALLVLDLAQLGWERARWETLAAVYPYADRGPESPGAAQAAELGTEVPVIRADWLAYAAGRPPL